MIYRKGQHSLSKVICLALGLAISSVVIAEIYYEQTFDTHFPGADRTYQITENIKMGDMKAAQEYNGTPGAWAQGLKSNAPIVEAATRTTGQWGSDTRLRLDDQKTITSNITLADSCFFDVFPQCILAGDPKKVLAQSHTVMVSSDIAKTIGGNVVGRHFTIDGYNDVTFTIGGVFEAFPWGSSMHGQNMLLSLNYLRPVDGFDSKNNWIGNDRYHSYIRLAKGHTADELAPLARRTLADHIDQHELKQAGAEVKMEFQTLNDAYTSDSYVKMMKWILSIVAFVLLFTSVMNYLLIVVGNMVGRSREMAVRKCYGAESHNIYGLIFKEATVDVGIAVILAAILVLLCKGTIENFLSAPVAALIFNRGAWILVAIVVIILFISGIVPAWLYNKTPVTEAFRGYNENRHRWKLGLLAAEFAVVGLMLSLLAVISSQYNKMMNLNPGYDYSNVAILNVQGVGSGDYKHCLEELQRLPQVKLTSAACYLPLDDWFGSGDDVSLPGDERHLFNACDLYWVNDNYMQVMGMKIVDGTWFTDRSDSCHQVMVDERFAKRLNATAHWKGSVVGRRVDITGHDPLVHFTIVGVFRDMQMGSVANHPDYFYRPTALFYAESMQPVMLLKLTQLSPETMQLIRDRVEHMFPNHLVQLESYATEYGNQYTQQLNFRNGILVGGIVVLVIALFGLVGYTSDEVQRRSKEIAIRKVNGATVRDILRLFIKDIIRIAIPSIIVGDIGAWLIAAQWLQNFTQRITLTIWPFLAVTIIILLIIAMSVTINSWRVANSNPVRYLKDE